MSDGIRYRYGDHRDNDHRPREEHEHNGVLKSIDSNKDGVISADEIEREKSLLEIYQVKEKASSQRKMAWGSLGAMVIVTGLLFTPLIPNERVDTLGDILPLFYISMASIVGFYFGAQAYMDKGVTFRKR